MRPVLVSLRTKLLLLFMAFAVSAVASVGVYGYAQSLRSLESLLSNQAASLAEDAAKAVEARLTLEESDILLLTENGPTQQLLASAADTSSRERHAIYAEANAFLVEAWRQIGTDYRSLELRNTSGRIVYRVGEKGQSAPGSDAGNRPPLAIRRDIRDIVTRQLRGSVVLEVSEEALLPRELLQRKVGKNGYSFVADRRSDRILYHPAHAVVGQPSRSIDSAGRAGFAGTIAGKRRGTFHMGRGDSARVAAFANIESIPWTVVSTALVGEFSGPFVTARTNQVIAVAIITVLVTLGFFRTLHQATRSLVSLTYAAEEMGRGNLSPVLPAGGRDEVGKLSETFASMTRHIREMVDQIEASHQMTVLGEFAGRIAHEIRNPLTAVKLNLQGLSRDARDNLLPPDSARSLELSLNEIGRLDRVVSGVLELGRVHSSKLDPCSMHELILASVHLVEAQAGIAGVTLAHDLGATSHVVLGDATELQGVCLNLLYNAIKASSPGGTVKFITSNNFTTEGEHVICIRLLDQGHGINPELRERVFVPFVTTRRDGTGLGLPIARRTIEAHRGSLRLAETASTGFSTEFMVQLPVVDSSDPDGGKLS